MPAHYSGRLCETCNGIFDTLYDVEEELHRDFPDWKKLLDDRPGAPYNQPNDPTDVRLAHDTCGKTPPHHMNITSLKAAVDMDCYICVRLWRQLYNADFEEKNGLQPICYTWDFHRDILEFVNPAVMFQCFMPTGVTLHARVHHNASLLI